MKINLHRAATTKVVVLIIGIVPIEVDLAVVRIEVTIGDCRPVASVNMNRCRNNDMRIGLLFSSPTRTRRVCAIKTVEIQPAQTCRYIFSKMGHKLRSLRSALTERDTKLFEHAAIQR